MFASIPGWGLSACVCLRSLRPPAPRMGHQVLAVRLNKKKCQHSVPGGCAGSSPLPAALRSEHPQSQLRSCPARCTDRPALALSAVTPSLLPKGSDGHFGRTVEVQRVLEQTLEAALTFYKTGTSHSPCKFLPDPKTDQRAHLLDSHVQLMADEACCLLSPLF